MNSGETEKFKKSEAVSVHFGGWVFPLSHSQSQQSWTVVSAGISYWQQVEVDGAQGARK